MEQLADSEGGLLGPDVSKVTRQTLVHAQCEAWWTQPALTGWSLNQTQLTPNSWKTTRANILLFVLGDVWRIRKPFVVAVKASLINEDRYRCNGFNDFLWFQNLNKHECMLANSLQLCLTATPWTVAHQAPLSMEFSRREYWSGLPCLPPGGSCQLRE